MPFGGLLAAGIGAGTSVLGGIFQNTNAKKQAAALKQTGIDVAHSIEKATGGAIDAGYQGITQANAALNTGYDRATGAITAGRDAATGAVTAGVSGANQALTDAYGKEIGYLNPYLTAGQQGLSQLQAFMAPGGGGSKQFNASMMEANDPGYAFRMKAGQDALAKTAAASGSSLGGGFAKSLANYSQNAASAEYQNAFQRYMAGQQQQYSMLSGLANYGQHATDLAVGSTADYGRGLSANTMTGAGLNAGYNFGAGTALANAGLSTGSQLANVGMQGNQWIGSMGLSGAEAAGNAYFAGEGANAAVRNAGNSAMWQGIGRAVGQLGGGLLNYWAQPKTPAPPTPTMMDPSLINWDASLANFQY